MISSIGVYENKYLYKNKEYDKFNVKLLVEELSKKRRIIILSQAIFIKKYRIYNKRINIEKFIEKKIIEDFSDKTNLLFHYEFIKESKYIYIYSIRYDNIMKLCEDCSYLEINPIQFLIQKYILKNIKKSKFSIIMCKINDLFHLINMEAGAIENSIVTKNISDIDLFLKNYKDDNKMLIIDKNIKDITIDTYDYIIDIGEKFYEEIFRK